MLEFRPFQEREYTTYAPRKRFGITWDMGLGKTAFAARVGAEYKCVRWLVLCPDNAISVWGGNPKFEGITALDWIRRYWPEVEVEVEIVQGEPWNREVQWAAPYRTEQNKIHIRLCTIDTFMRDWREQTKTGLKGKRATKSRFVAKKNYQIPQIVIYDEARRIRNKDTQAFKILDGWMTYYNPSIFLPMTGTPGHEPKHFWTMLHLLDRKYFRSYWDFVHAFHMVDDTGFGMEINEPKNLPQFHTILKRYFSTVREEEVVNERPPLTRQLLSIEMDTDQKRLYRDFYEDMMTHVAQDDKFIWAENEFTIATRLRQVLICPRILSPSLSVGRAIEDFAETVEPGENYVIFTPFTSAFQHFQGYLESRGFPVTTLQGGIGTEERDDRLRVYREQRGVCICSILYAQAFSLEPATKAFFIGYDWDPDNNRQAEKRLHRLTTVSPITAYYYTYRSTFDEKLANIVNIKQVRVNQTMPPHELRELLNANG